MSLFRRALPSPAEAGAWDFSLAAVLSLLLLLGASAGWRWSNARHQRGLLEQEAARFETALARQFQGHAEGLRGIMSRFPDPDRVTAAQWASALEGTDLFHRFPGFMKVEYMPRVPPEGVKDFEGALVREGRPGIRIWDLTGGPGGPLRRAEAYYPIRFLTPLDGKALGFDVSCREDFQAALMGPLSRGEPTLSQRVRLVEEPGLVAVGMTVPHLGPGRAIRGLFGGMIRIPLLIRQVRGEVASDLRVEFYEEDPWDPERLLYFEQLPAFRRRDDAGPGLTVRRAFRILGQPYALVLTSTPAWETRTEDGWGLVRWLGAWGAVTLALFSAVGIRRRRTGRIVEE